MIYEQIEGFLIDLNDKTKRERLDWLPLLAFPEKEALTMEFEEGVSEANYGLESISKKDSYFLKSKDGYVFLFNVRQDDHAENSPAPLALMVKVNSALPIDNLSAFVNGEEHQKDLAALKELIENYLRDKYPLPDTLYTFMSEV